MNNNKGLVAGLLAVLVAFLPVTGSAQTTFDGMSRVADWTDLEGTSNEIPAQVWGTCDADTEDRIGMRVDYDNGLSGTISFSGVSGIWNTSAGTFGITPDVATGFFASCTDFHFLFNNGSTLPIAWNSCSNAFSNNFDLDYSESFGSHFRASTSGWVSARFQTYCGSGAAAPAEPAEIPTLPLSGLILTILALAGLSARRLRHAARRR